MLRTGARFPSKFQDAPHGSAIFNEKQRNLEDALQGNAIPHGSAIYSRFSGCSARERDFERKNDEILRMLDTGARFSAILLEVFTMLRTGSRFCSKFSGCSARERDFQQNFENAPHGNSILSKLSGCSAREHDFCSNFQHAPHGSAIFVQIFNMLRTGSRFCSKFSGCSARERDFQQNFENAPHGNWILSKLSGCSAREHDFCSNFQHAPHGSAILNHGVTNTIPKLYRRPPLKRALLNQENEIHRDSFGIELV